jgi:antitoxin VapB
MALNIRNPKTEKLAAELAALTGESKTEAVTKALEERLKLVRQRVPRRHLVKRLDEIARHCASLPVLDEKAADTLLYDERGLPGP